VEKYNIVNLDCAECASKIENHLRKHPAVRQVMLDFATLTLHIDTDDIEAIRREIKKIEPGVDLTLREQGAGLKPQKGTLDFHPQKDLATISVAVALFLIQLFFKPQLQHLLPWGVGEYAVALAAYLLAGWNVLAGAARTIRKGHMFDENVLMTIATVGAFAIHAVSEAVAVMIFFKIGEFLQNLAVARSRKSIKALLEIKPDHANLITKAGVKRIPPEQVTPGDSIIVKAGEKIPLDGEVVDGSSLVNTSALTGESVPTTVKAGDVVLAGEINTNGLLTVRVTKAYAESSVARLIDLVENATVKKAKTEQFISRFARWYTPVVVFLALCLALLPPLLFAGQQFSTWLYRALVLLVISCPCALVISVPLGYFGGIGGASRRGILVKGSNFIDALADVKTVVFDKTGTLTKGVFKVNEVKAAGGYAPQEVLAFAALAEAHSNHPIAKSIADAEASAPLDLHELIVEHQEIAGHGVKVSTRTHTIVVGHEALMQRENIAHDACTAAGTFVHVAINGTYAGAIVIGDELKADSREAITLLRKEGVHTIAMLTGDSQSAAKIIADTLKLDVYYAGLLPEDKVRLFESASADRRFKGKIAFVGDGINDAPVIARADVGMAMGALGSDAAIETADVVLMTDHPSKMAEAIAIGKRTRSIVWQNILFALGIKSLFMVFGAFGLAGMWEAVIADMGTAVVAVLNSTRALNMDHSHSDGRFEA
jgi:Cd2+/Zn2+-exporting ATPase